MHTSRRHFLKQAALVPFAISSGFDSARKAMPPLSFSTLGTPDWSYDAILDFAAKHSYSGIELRGLKREMDLTKSPEFSTPERIAESKSKAADKGIKLLNLGSSATMHYAEADKREKNMDEGKRFIDLAAALDCPYVRIYPNNYPNDEAKEKVIERIIKGFNLMGNHAKGTGVTVIMETHGDWLLPQDIRQVMDAVTSPSTGLLWDVYNMWNITKQSPSEVYPQIKSYIKHIHLKDAAPENDKMKYVLFLQGVAPMREAMDLLRKDEYKGYYGFEWEKLWHPDIAEPDIAMSGFSKEMKRYFKKAK